VGILFSFDGLLSCGFETGGLADLERSNKMMAALQRKTDWHVGRCYLKGRESAAANVILTAVGYTSASFLLG
jgi:hypothetical protein